MRIAMWSGPRNISTALLRAWGQRADTAVVDEPLYAHYLAATGAEHPGREELLERHEADAEVVVRELLGPIPDGRAIFYQKHMAHHLLDGMDRSWLARMTNVFLIRAPEEMLTSLLRVLPGAGIAETGLPQQVDLFRDERARTGRCPIVLDARDVLERPEPMLAALCDALGIAFDPAMLSWLAGPRPTDGVWARHRNDSVPRSTGFAPYQP